MIFFLMHCFLTIKKKKKRLQCDSDASHCLSQPQSSEWLLGTVSERESPLSLELVSPERLWNSYVPTLTYNVHVLQTFRTGKNLTDHLAQYIYTYITWRDGNTSPFSGKLSSVCSLGYVLTKLYETWGFAGVNASWVTHEYRRVCICIWLS